MAAGTVVTELYVDEARTARGPWGEFKIGDSDMAVFDMPDRPAGAEGPRDITPSASTVDCGRANRLDAGARLRLSGNNVLKKLK